MPDDLAIPDVSKTPSWAARFGKFINGVWYVLATVVAFITFVSAAEPKIVGALATIGGGIGQIYTALFQRPTLVNREELLASLPASDNLTAAHADGYIYYEVSKIGKLTSDGRLAPIPTPASLPDFEKLLPGQIMRAEDEIYLRAKGDPTAQTLGIVAAGRCVQVVDGKTYPRPVQIARTGGYLPVRRAACPS